MNNRLLIAIGLSVATVLAMQYFTQKSDPIEKAGGTASTGEIRSGQFYNAPVQQCWHKEPNREIDFVDVKIDPKNEKVIKIETKYCNVSFSNFGGVIKILSFKKHHDAVGKDLETIYGDSMEEREGGCFLLAFDEKTPYLYSFVLHDKQNGENKVVYQTKVDGWLVRKTYILQDESYKIDMQLDFEPEKENFKPINPRLFFPAPLVFGVADNAVNGFVTRDGKKIEKISVGTELSGIWGAPEIFGGEDKFFAHTLVKDASHFVLGGYYKKINNKLFSILEGPEISEKKNWKLSFYFGPKLLDDLSLVDERLEDLLSFGWLSWFCKILLKFLETLFNYFGNYGIAIIVLTFLLKLPFLPLSISSRRKMEEYQKYQPTLNRIRTKYKHDLKKQQEEIMKFHQEHNLSPATPMIGCLPMLIQLPILFALYRVLNNYLSLYHAPFFGWMRDLSSKDPYYVLPILMGLTMLWQQKMTPVVDEKQRLMMMFMPIVMTAIFINFPAGLVLYWLTNNVLTVGEDLLRKRIFS